MQRPQEETMNFLITLVALGTLSSMNIASAAVNDAKNCDADLQAAAKPCDAVLYEQLMIKHTGIKECKVVQFNGTNEAGNQQKVDMQVYLLGNKGLVIQDNQSPATCQLHYMSLNDNAIEAKVFEGRVVMRSESGKIYAITRLGGVKEVYNRDNKPYYGVKNIKINETTKNVEITHHSFETLSSTDFFERLNTANRSSIMGL